MPVSLMKGKTNGSRSQIKAARYHHQHKPGSILISTFYVSGKTTNDNDSATNISWVE